MGTKTKINCPQIDATDTSCPAYLCHSCTHLKTSKEGDGINEPFTLLPVCKLSYEPYPRYTQCIEYKKLNPVDNV